MKSITKG